MNNSYAKAVLILAVTLPGLVFGAMTIWCLFTGDLDGFRRFCPWFVMTGLIGAFAGRMIVESDLYRW